MSEGDIIKYQKCVSVNFKNVSISVWSCSTGFISMVGMPPIIDKSDTVARFNPDAFQLQ